MKRLSTVVSIIALCAVSASAAPPLVPRPAPRTLDRLTRPDLGVESHKGDRKVSSRLRAAAGWVGPLAGPLVPADLPRSPEGKLQVYVDCSPLGAEQLAALEEAGVTVDGVEPARGRVRGSIDPAALDRVAEFSWVHAVRPVDRAVVRAGGTTTEGDAAARADLVRAQGLDGTGVVVGVISDGIDNLREAQQSGDLSEVKVPDGCRRGSGDEGTALLEIVHDVAPGAQLLFAGPADSFEMVEAVECLLAAGADVIVDDLGFFGEPFFEDGPVAEAVRGAVKGGVSYHSSAGNEAEEHLEQDFVATPNSTLHDFAGGAGDNTNTVVVPAGGTLTCILQWNDPFGGSANDYDLFLLDQNGDLITDSILPQQGAQDPIEVVAVTNPSANDALANVVIDRFAGEARRLELFCFGAGAFEHVTAAGSIIGHPALDEVVAVAAIDAADPGLDEVEPFSSRGPARVDFPARQDRAKPDLAGFDGVSISNAGGFPACPPFCAFFGTSAASPHTAGVAALLLQKDPSLTPAAVQAALRAGAVDIGGAGVDDASGFGRLDALASAEAVVAPQCAGDDECTDGDACTVDACDPVRGCISTPLGGVEGVACRLGQLTSHDVCGPGEIDARTEAVIAKRVGSALTLLDKASQVSGGAREKLLGKVARQLDALRRRVSRAEARETIPGACASTLEGLIESAQALVRTLAG
jgi:subtilisin family serine protease